MKLQVRFRIRRTQLSDLRCMYRMHSAYTYVESYVIKISLEY